MMNNRQAGRRRGRGGQRSQGNPNSGSRIDNRQRGNANQLYEKYKNLARDAQMQGDRVNTEYYLQFADHYFRVLNENKPRFDDNRRPDADEEIDGEDEGEDRGRHAQRRDRDEQRPNGRANGNGYAAEDDGNDGEAPRRQARERRPLNGGAEAPVEGERAVEGEVASEAAPRRRGRPRKEAAPAEAAGLDADRLPPSLGASANDDAGEEKPRRRRGRPPAGEATGTAG
ncbi:MAG: DUF4167 domain-containing protein [Sphingomonas sp.]